MYTFISKKIGPRTAGHQSSGFVCSRNGLNTGTCEGFDHWKFPESRNHRIPNLTTANYTYKKRKYRGQDGDGICVRLILGPQHRVPVDKGICVQVARQRHTGVDNQ